MTPTRSSNSLNPIHQRMFIRHLGRVHLNMVPVDVGMGRLGSVVMTGLLLVHIQMVVVVLVGSMRHLGALAASHARMNHSELKGCKQNYS